MVPNFIFHLVHCCLRDIRVDCSCHCGNLVCFICCFHLICISNTIFTYLMFLLLSLYAFRWPYPFLNVSAEYALMWYVFSNIKTLVYSNKNAIKIMHMSLIKLVIIFFFFGNILHRYWVVVLLHLPCYAMF